MYTSRFVARRWNCMRPEGVNPAIATHVSYVKRANTFEKYDISFKVYSKKTAQLNFIVGFKLGIKMQTKQNIQLQSRNNSCTQQHVYHTHNKHAIKTDEEEWWTQWVDKGNHKLYIHLFYQHFATYKYRNNSTELKAIQ